MQQTFGKQERLRGARAFSTLFESGNSLLTYPVKVVWILSGDDQPFPAAAAFTVSRKNFRNATDRNLLKRRMREAYRLNKSSFYEAMEGKKMHIAFIYIAREIVPYRVIEKSISNALSKLKRISMTLPDGRNG